MSQRYRSALAMARRSSGRERLRKLIKSTDFVVETLEHRTLLAAINLSQEKLGNIFTTAEAVHIPLTSTGATIEWTVNDYYGAQVASGTTPVSGGAATIAPGTTAKGYFQMHLTAKNGATVLGTADTTYATLAPVDVATMQDSKFGVQTHFAQGWNPDVIPLIAKAGIAWARDEQYWNNVETTANTYNFSQYTAYMNALATNHVQPFMEADFANPLYDSNNTPYTNAGRTGYANYIGAFLNQYGSTLKTMEIWNEYNGSFATGPVTADRPLYYTQMLQAAYNKIKTLRPDVQVLGGAAVLNPLGYFHNMFQDGALSYMDGIVIHPYTSTPESIDKDLDALKALMQADGGVVKPIYATEGGINADGDTVGKEEMARYLVRYNTMLMTENVAFSSWYLGKDYDIFQTGLLAADNNPMGKYVPTAAYVSYANLINQFYHYNFASRETTDPRTRVYKFTNGSNEMRVAWNTDGNSTVSFNTSSNLTVVDIMGNSTTYTPSGGKVTLTIGLNPIYIKGTVTSVTDNQRPDTVIADNSIDYPYTASFPQGTNGWYYGQYDGDGTGSGNGSSPTGAYTDDDFENMTYVLQDYGYKWTSPYGFQELNEAGGHPSMNGGNQAWSVRRWVSDYAGTVTLSGTLYRDSGSGDGTGGKILKNGTQVYSATVTPSSKTANYNFNVTVAVGDIIDFAITPGPGGDTSFDATTFTARVTAAVTGLVAPSGLAATAASSSQINLSWTDNSSTETGFKVERATDAAFTQNVTLVTTTAANATSYSNTGLSASTTYYYRVRATNGSTDSANSNTSSATTQAAGSPPAAPSGLSASAVSSSQINLSWTDNSGNETGFKVERATDSGFTQNVTLVTTTASNATSYSNTGLSASTTYYYRVRATNAQGDSANTTVANATTQAASGSATQVNLSTYFNQAAIYPVGGQFAISTGFDYVAAYPSASLGSTLTYGGNTFNLGAASTNDVVKATGQTLTLPSGSYSSVVILMAATDNMSGNFTFNYTTGSPTVTNQSVSGWGTPQSLSNEAIVMMSTTRNQFNGTVATQNTYLYAYTFTVDNARTLTSLTLPNPGGINNYGIKLLAIDLLGAAAPTVPTAPSGLSATTVSASQINLSWTDNSNNETGFKVERATDAAFTQNVTLVTTAAANATSYSNTGLSASTTYYYRVRATNTAGDSANTSVANATTGTTPPSAPSGLSATAVSSSQINLSWTDNSSNETGFKVERATDSGFTQNVTLVTTTAANATSYSNTGLTASTTYYYRVRATNTGGDSANTSVANATTQAASSSTQVNLSAAFNQTAIYAPSATYSFNTAFNYSQAYLSTALGSTVTVGSDTFNIGTTGANDVVNATGQTVSLPSGNYSKVVILMAATGNMTNKTFTFNYTTGAATNISQSVSGWDAAQGYSNEVLAKSMTTRSQFNGIAGTTTTNIYAYTFFVDNTRTLTSVTLPNAYVSVDNQGIKILAMNVVT